MLLTKNVFKNQNNINFQNGAYAFVLGVQFPITNKEANPQKLRIVDEIFRLLPDTASADFELE